MISQAEKEIRRSDSLIWLPMAFALVDSVWRTTQCAWLRLLSVCCIFESYDSDREQVWGCDQVGLAVVGVDDRSSKSASIN